MHHTHTNSLTLQLQYSHTLHNTIMQLIYTTHAYMHANMHTFVHSISIHLYAYSNVQMHTHVYALMHIYASMLYLRGFKYTFAHSACVESVAPLDHVSLTCTLVI